MTGEISRNTGSLLELNLNLQLCHAPGRGGVNSPLSENACDTYYISIWADYPALNFILMSIPSAFCMCHWTVHKCLFVNENVA